MPDKSYVTMERCLLCGGDTGAIIMDRRLRNTFERYTTFPTSVCDTCRKKYLVEGILLVNPQTGRLVVLKEEAYKRMFNVPIPKGRIAFAKEELLTKIQEANSRSVNVKGHKRRF